MCAIGRGQSAAEKLFSIMGLFSPVNHSRWAEHTKVIEEKVKELTQEELSEAALEVKESLQEDQSKPYAVAGMPFDGSWCSRGWSATDACVTAISVDTGKVVDIIHMNSSCSESKKMESAREGKKVTKEKYLEWFLDHEPNCYLNHEGSSSVGFAIILSILKLLCYYHLCSLQIIMEIYQHFVFPLCKLYF